MMWPVSTPRIFRSAATTTPVRSLPDRQWMYGGFSMPPLAAWRTCLSNTLTACGAVWYFSGLV